MRRELQILRWSVAGVVILMSLLCLWTIRMRRLQNNGRTASTTGTNVETPVSVRSSPPLPFPVVSQNLPRPSESPVLSLRGEASATFVRASDAVLLPSPSGQTARHRRHVNVTPTVSQEALLSCLQRSHQLLPSPCISLFGVPSVNTQNGRNEPDPHSRNFQSSNEWYKRGGQDCNGDNDDVSVC